MADSMAPAVWTAISPYLNLFYPTIADVNGNILGIVTNGVVTWNSSRVTAYGAVPDYRPLTLGTSGSLANKYAWRNRATESINLVWLGANWYDPIDGHFLSPDPMGHDANVSLYDFCGGDPVNYFDPDGRCSDPSSPNPGQQSPFGQNPILAGLYQDYLQSQQDDYIAGVAGAYATGNIGRMADALTQAASLILKIGCRTPLKGNKTRFLTRLPEIRLGMNGTTRIGIARWV